MAQMRVRNYVFTLNNHTPLMIQNILKQAEDGNDVDTAYIIKYLVMQEETGASGTHHLQGYMELKRAMTIRSVKRAIGGVPGLHLERRRGTQAQAIAYSQKEDTRDVVGGMWEVGVKKRAREGGIVDAVLDGVAMVDIAREFPEQFVRQYRGINALREELEVHRDWDMKVEIYYGPTGTGKSWMAFHNNPEAYSVTWPAKGGTWWWPGYDGQEVVILDEFRHQISLTKMLKLLDRYHEYVQYKGGHRKFTSKKLIFTTNIEPMSSWYPAVANREPLLRRIRQFAKIYDFVELDEDENGDPKADFTIRDMSTGGDENM